MARPSPSALTTLVLPALLVAVTLAAFIEVRSYPFLLFDDTQYVTENPHIRQGLTLASLRWALTSFYGSNWHPLTWGSHMLDYQLYGLEPGGHHVTNLVLHAANAVLLYAALVAMTGCPWRSAVVAALFAVHPLRVESVAQVAERKDVLSGTFWMLTLWTYARYVRRSSWKWYAAMCFSFALGLMAKSMLVTLPFVLLLLDWWPLGRVFRTVTPTRAIGEKLPLFVLAALASGFTVVAQSRAGLVLGFTERSIGERLANAVTSYATYVFDMLWPMNLSFFYPYPELFDAGTVVGAALLLVAITALAIFLLRTRPYVAVGWFWYLGTLVPVIGLVGIGGLARADHYTYLPLIGLFIAITWGAWDAGARVPRREVVLGAAAVLVIGACVAATRIEAAYWRDSRVLFERALALNPRNFLAHNNLGLVWRAEGRSAEAKREFEAALAAAPRNVEARNHLGLTQRDLGDPASAVASFEEAIRLAPDYAPARFNLGETLLLLGDDARAVAELETTVRLVPDHPNAHLQLSRLYARQGNAARAVEHAQIALTLLPGSAAASAAVADALSVSGKLPEAVTYYQQALQLEPNDVDSWFNLGNTLARQGRMTEAAEAYRRTIALAPDYTRAHDNLARALTAADSTGR